jgi:hypothetical protein
MRQGNLAKGDSIVDVTPIPGPGYLKILFTELDLPPDPAGRFLFKPF